MAGGLIAFYSMVYGVVMSLISFVIALVVAAIAGTKNMKSIWAWGICFQLAVLLYLLFEHYFDGSHYTGPISSMIIALMCILVVASFVVIVMFTKAKKWKPFMWVFSFIIPACVFVFCVDLDLDPRPYSQKQIESMIGITLPRYSVSSYEEHSPGGDDWECNCRMKINMNSNLDAFRKALEDKCSNSAGELSESGSDCDWNKTDGVYYCRKQFDIERFLTMEFDINNRTISYQYLKI